MSHLKHYLACLLAFLSSILWAQDAEIPIKSYTTDFRQSPIVIDGVLDDAAWEQVEWGTDFTQIDPDQGSPNVADDT